MIKPEEIPTLYQKLKSHIARDFRSTTIMQTTISGGGGGATSFSGLTGTIANAQAPQFLLRDGSRSLTGSLSVDDGITIDGIDISAHAANVNAHHNQQHSITGSDHTITGATLSLVGATATNTLGLITPSSNPGTTESVLKATSGLLTLPSFTATTGMTTPLLTATTKVTTPLIDTASGSLTLTPAGGTVAVTAALTVGTNATIAGVASLASGSVGAPGLTFTGDTNTGIYRSGTDAYSLVAGGAAIINVGATGAGVNAAYDSTAALKVQSVANDDITLFLKQKSGQTARMWRVEDSAGQELIVLDSQGNLQSGNPGFASGLTGWQITPAGNAEFNNITARGELHASIFVMDEFHASGGTLVVSPAGKLENDATVYTTTGAEAILDIRTTSVTGSGSQLDIRTTSGTGSGTQITARWVENYFEITDPPSGHATIFAAGDTLRSKALGNPGAGIDLYDIWGTVSRVEDMTDYYRYYYHRQSGGSNGIVIPAGTGIISYGAEGDGRILLTADQNYAPYIDIFTSGATPWTGDIIPHTRLGRLDGVGLPGVSGVEQYGMVTSTDLSDANAPYIINSNLQMFSYNVDSEWNNGNPTARITSGGVFKLGTDIDSASTTGLDFNPVTGALTIGSASYPGSVTVYGNITVTGGNAAKVDFSNITATLDSVPNGSTYFRTTANQVTGAGRAFTALNGSNSLVTSVIPATAVTPGGAGLFLGSNYMGYHNGTDWKTYTDSSGNWKLLGNASNNYIQWAAASNKLQGVGGGVEQWYADATDGKFYAAGGSLGMDNTGLWLKMNTASSWATANAIAFRNASNLSLVVAALLTRTVTSSQYLSLVIDPNGTPVGIEIIASPAATRTNITHDLTVQGTTTLNNDLDMGGNDIIDANNVMGVRSTAAL